jgi:hypothetical protein
MNTLTFKQILLGSLIAVGVAALANNLWNVAHQAITGLTIPAVINAGPLACRAYCR